MKWLGFPGGCSSLGKRSLAYNLELYSTESLRVLKGSDSEHSAGSAAWMCWSTEQVAPPPAPANAPGSCSVSSEEKWVYRSKTGKDSPVGSFSRLWSARAWPCCHSGQVYSSTALGLSYLTHKNNFATLIFKKNRFIEIKFIYNKLSISIRKYFTYYI